MATGEEDALSDLEDDPVPPPPPAFTKAPPPAHPPANNLNSLLAELETEKQARKAAETSRAEMAMRFKNYTHEAARQKEELNKQKEDAERSKEELSKRLNEIVKQRDEIAHQRDDAIKTRDELSKQKDDAIKARDTSRSEIEAAARLLVESAEKILAKVASIKTFPGNLPRAAQHTGVAAIAYGYTRRAEDIIDELVRQHEVASKTRSELREQMEQHSYQMAIEVSEMEATIQSLKDDVSQKTSETEKLKKLSSEKDVRISELEREVSKATKQIDSLKTESQNAMSKIEKMKDAISQLSNLIFKGSEALEHVACFASPPPTSNRLSHSSIRADPEEGLQDCLSRIREFVDCCAKVSSALNEERDTKKQQIGNLEDTVAQLTREKQEITDFLRNALANKHETSDSIAYSEQDKPHIVSMASALENEIKGLRQQVFELQQHLASARGELQHATMSSERQSKELILRLQKIQELEEKQSTAQDNIEDLNMQLASAKEEILHWKQAATKEAEAGRNALDELERCQDEISALKSRTVELAQALEESNSKLRSKEEMTIAAIAARNAAERSLRIADERAVELRERVEELNRQFDALERLGDGGISGSLFNMCWPTQWLRARPLFFQGNSTAQPSAEMGELFEPLV